MSKLKVKEIKFSFEMPWEQAPNGLWSCLVFPESGELLSMYIRKARGGKTYTANLSIRRREIRLEVTAYRRKTVRTASKALYEYLRLVGWTP